MLPPVCIKFYIQPPLSLVVIFPHAPPPLVSQTPLQVIIAQSLSSIRFILFYKGTPGRNEERDSQGREVLCYRAQICNVAPGMYVIRFVIKGTAAYAILDDSVMHRQPLLKS